MGNLAYAKDWTLNLRERSTNNSVHCVLQTVGGNRVVICSERNFTLDDPIPIIKKPEVEPLKPTTKSTTSSFLELLQRNGK